ncbi:ModD protein [Halarcobacter ebronensis]|uniref:Putative pyrophosphorylase ModD n=1 Tax=Halarcobacter ebronensis TaxID=1462615 RepID=A0A4Q0YDI0_9BACT|nr:ModD protein [Halarcobacter ebronensis]RXJ68520.1 ModD protein [Halarcobacter ebronensis]
MFNLTNSELEKYIQEDIPYFDLTTSLQKCKDKKAQLEVYTREDIVVSCTEEAATIAKLLNCEVEFFVKSCTKVSKGEILLKYSGEYEDIHKAWRAAQMFLEYSCKISTQAYKMKEKIDEVNNSCELLTTRKTFPFSKRFCIKATLCGGATPHRLGLSESILFFDGHRLIYKDNKEFYEAIKEIKSKLAEKKLGVESESYEDSVELMKYGADTIQLDKIDLQTLEKIVSYKNVNFPNVKILAAGGINLSNVQEYAKCGIDGVVTSSVYVCGLANLSSRIKIIE